MKHLCFFGILLLSILLIASVSAVELSNTFINASVINSTINVTSTIYFNSITVDSNYIYFDKLRLVEDSSETISFNITARNLTLFMNSTRKDLPYFSSTDYNSKTLSTSIDLNNTIVYLSASTCIIDNINYTSGKNNFSALYDNPNCSNGIVTFSSLDIEATDNIFAFDYDMPLRKTSPISNQIVRSIIALLVILGIISMVGYPVYKNHDEWDTSDWIKWMLYSLVIVIFGCIVVANMFSI